VYYLFGNGENTRILRHHFCLSLVGFGVVNSEVIENNRTFEIFFYNLVILKSIKYVKYCVKLLT
jgi:hypothetical protein